MITASALPRLAVCPGSAALPQAETTSELADAGTVRHSAVETAVIEGRLDDIPEAVRDLITPGSLASAEVAIAYNWRTGAARHLGLGARRDYAVAADEIPGTIDLLIVNGRRVVVVDYKGHEDIGAPDEHEQSMLYALAASRIYDADEVTLVIAYIGQGVESARIRRVTVDAIELISFATRVTKIMKAVAEQLEAVRGHRLPDVRESRHCKYCSSVAACPAKTALIRRLVSGEESDELSLLLPLDDEAARFAYERLGQARQLLKRIESAIYARAAESPIPLGGGRWLGKHTKPGVERLDGDTTYDIVRDMHGQAIADLAVERKATKTGIRAALKEAGVKPLAKAEAAVIAAVRAAGGATKESTETVGEFVAALTDGTKTEAA